MQNHGRREGLKNVLRQAGLLPAAFRIYEGVLAVAGRRRATVEDDGLPLPPALLRVRVVGSGDPGVFLRKGAAHSNLIASAVAAAHAPIEGAQRILDFGCGCGRILRYWRDLPGEVYGSDHDAGLIRWCEANLTFAHFAVNGLTPPLGYANDSFDLVYAFSVFTHIPGRLQRPWFEELARVTRPGGHLFLTTHGDGYADTRLIGSEREAFRAGRLVTRDEDAAGSNACAAFHPVSYVRDELSQGMTEARFERGREGGLMQDVWLFRKPPAAEMLRAGRGP